MPTPEQPVSEERPYRAQSPLDQLFINLTGELGFASQHLPHYPVWIFRGGDQEWTALELGYDRHLCQLLVVALVAWFEAFLEVTAMEALRNRPERIAAFGADGRAAFQLGDLAGAQDLSDLRRRVAERLVVGTGGQRFGRYVGVMRKVGAPLPDIETTEGRSIAEIFERRNVITHNRSAPDDAYLAVCPTPSVSPSGGLITDLPYLESAVSRLAALARRLTDRLVDQGALDPSFRLLSPQNASLGATEEGSAGQ